MGQRVVITGLGAVTPLGNDVPSSWAGMVGGRSGVGRITAYDPSDQNVQMAAEASGFDAVAHLGRKQARRTARFTQMALVAADEAVRDAGLALGQNGMSDDIAVLIGTGVGGVETLLENHDVFRDRGPGRVSPLMVPQMMANAPSGEIAIQYGLRGLSFCVSSACATGNHAIGEAARLVRLGVADGVICGGSEAAIQPLCVAAFDNMQAISRRNGEPERASRPFDADRDGFVLGEGACIFVLESLANARARGARIRAEVLGYGASSDAFHITAPDKEGAGAVLSMRRALSDAGLAPEEIEYINAHGTSTPLNDATETRAIHTVFGDHAYKVPISSTKSMVGHLLGAAGAVEALACVMALETGVVHPTINYETPDPDCYLDYVPNEARETNPRKAMSNSFGFGGHNATLIFGRWEE